MTREEFKSLMDETNLQVIPKDACEIVKVPIKEYERYVVNSYLIGTIIEFLKNEDYVSADTLKRIISSCYGIDVFGGSNKEKNNGNNED